MAEEANDELESDVSEKDTEEVVEEADDGVSEEDTEEA